MTVAGINAKINNKKVTLINLIKKNILKVHIALSIFITTLFTGCYNPSESREKKYIKMKNVKDVLTNIQQEYTIYEVSNTQDVSIECNNGTIIFIPANSFVSNNGSSPKENIILKINNLQN